MSSIPLLLSLKAKAEVVTTKTFQKSKWGLTGFNPMHDFMVLVYNSVNQNMLINDLYITIMLKSAK